MLSIYGRYIPDMQPNWKGGLSIRLWGMLWLLDEAN